MEKEEGTLNRKSLRNIFKVKTIMVLTKILMLKRNDYCDANDQEKRERL